MAERIALIGAGVVGKRHIEAIAATDAAELVAIADPAPEAVEIAAAAGVPHFADTAQMLRSAAPAGVIVATPTEHHLEPSLAVLKAGCHLLVEKPIAASVKEAEEISRVAAAAGRDVLVGHQRRYCDQVAKAREVVQGGMLGQLVAVSGQWCMRKPPEYYAPAWRRRGPAGPVLTNLIHEIDYLRHIVGEILSVAGLAGNPVLGFEKEDTAAFAVEFAGGALGAFVLSDQADSPFAWELATGENPAFPRTGQNCITFSGTRGALEFPNLRQWTSDGPADWTAPKSVRELPMEPGDAFARQIAHFADVVAGRAAPIVTATDATQSLRATLAVLEAAQSGRRIDMRIAPEEGGLDAGRRG